MNCREIEPRDVPDLFTVRIATRENAMSRRELQALGITEESVLTMLGASHRGWLCEEDGRTVGFAMGNRQNGEVWVIALLPGFEGRGIGAELMGRVEEWLWSEGWSEIWLTTDVDPALRAYGFYRRLGWMDHEIRDGLRYMKKARPSPDCVGAIIRNEEGRVFVQRRTKTRKVLPGIWDIVGGHLEPGESLKQALAREIREETGWELRRMGRLIADWEWEYDGVVRHELDYLVEVDGDLGAPRLEAEKHDAFAWVGPDDVELLMEGRDDGDRRLRDIVARTFRLQGPGRVTGGDQARQPLPPDRPTAKVDD